MNDAQLFTIFLAIFITGILGFYAGMKHENRQNYFCFALLLFTLMISGAVAGINLISLVAKNF